MKNVNSKAAKILADILAKGDAYTNNSISLQFNFSTARTEGTAVLVLDDMDQ